MHNVRTLWRPSTDHEMTRQEVIAALNEARPQSEGVKVAIYVLENYPIANFAAEAASAAVRDLRERNGMRGISAAEWLAVQEAVALRLTGKLVYRLPEKTKESDPMLDFTKEEPNDWEF